jgi:hypothetical protein
VCQVRISAEVLLNQGIMEGGLLWGQWLWGKDLPWMGKDCWGAEIPCDLAAPVAAPKKEVITLCFFRGYEFLGFLCGEVR